VSIGTNTYSQLLAAGKVNEEWIGPLVIQQPIKTIDAQPADEHQDYPLTS
jgi:hypothetical protein